MKDKLYVQYGAGSKSIPGWLSFDASPTLRLQRLPIIGRLMRRKLNCIFDDEIRYGNIVSGLPVKDGVVDVVFCSHILEHLALSDFYSALANTYRILKSGGKFRVIVPNLRLDVEDYLSSYNSPSDGGYASIDFFKSMHVGKLARAKSLVNFIEEYISNSQHLWMWDDKSLYMALKQAGFVDIKPFVEGEGDPFDENIVLPEQPHQFERGIALQCMRP
jgi:SAM-dependent methyltransferase